MIFFKLTRLIHIWNMTAKHRPFDLNTYDRAIAVERDPEVIIK